MRDSCNHSRCTLPVGHICSVTGTHSPRLGWGVDADENDVSFCYLLLAVSREEQRLPSCSKDDLFQAWLVDRKLVAIPSGYSVLVNIQHSHLHALTLVGNHGHRRPANVTCTQANYLHIHRLRT